MGVKLEKLIEKMSLKNLTPEMCIRDRTELEQAVSGSRKGEAAHE